MWLQLADKRGDRLGVASAVARLFRVVVVAATSVSLVKSLTEVGQRPHKQRQRHQLPFPPHEKPHLHQDH